MKYTFEDAYKIFKDNGCELLISKEEYKNSQTPMYYKCSCGNESNIRLSCFIRGTRCWNCGHKNTANAKRLTYEYVRDYFISQQCELLEDHYINNSTLMKYRCKCGNIAYIRFMNFRVGNRCMKCSGNDNLTYEIVKEEFDERNYILLESQYINWETKMRYICPNGHHGSINWNNFKRGYGCRKCANEGIRGENNWRWNPNLTDEERLENESRMSDPRIKTWRKQVFKRDKRVCRVCGKIKKDIVAHHLDGYGWCVDRRYNVENGVTACVECHCDFHKIYKYGNNTKEQFEEYLILRKEAQASF